MLLNARAPAGANHTDMYGKEVEGKTRCSVRVWLGDTPVVTALRSVETAAKLDIVHCIAGIALGS